MSVRSRAASCAAVALAAVVSAAAHIPAADAKSPRAVDPAAMQPTLNPDFAPWSCWVAGAGITCQGEYDDAWSGDPIGLECDGRPVFSTGTRHERMTRWHTSGGLATRTAVQLQVVETFSLEPSGDGPTVRSDGHWNRLYVYPVPGERDSRVMREVGAYWLLRAGGVGTSFVDAGLVEYAAGQEEEVEGIVGMSGRHDYFENPPAVDLAICEALT